jgi:hypothetical protein
MKSDFSSVGDEGEASLAEQIVPKRTPLDTWDQCCNTNGGIDEDVNHKVKAWWKWWQASNIICDKKVPQNQKVN